MTLHTPSTHALFDPAWAQAIVQQRFATQIDLYRNIVQYSANLALRLIQSVPDDVPHHVLIAVLFRQAIAASDAAVELLAIGAVDQAHLEVRALVEARWSLIFALRDPVKWGRHIYVSSLRENRSRARRFIPGTPEFAGAQAERGLATKFGPAPVDDAERKATEGVAAIDAILQRPEYSTISESYEDFAQKRKFEAPWYFDGAVPAADQIKSIKGLAKAVNAVDEYDSVYKYTSDHTHGGSMSTHLAFDELGVYLEPVRTPEGLRSTLLMSFAATSDCCRRLIQQWRPGEMAAFLKQYAEEWQRLQVDFPDVEVVRSHAVNR